jgi:hypothetical protein
MKNINLSLATEQFAVFQFKYQLNLMKKHNKRLLLRLWRWDGLTAAARLKVRPKAER